MLQILGHSKRFCNGLTRRELLQAGGAGMLGFGLADLLQADENQLSANVAHGSFGKAKSCIVLFLYGAWSQPDTFDLKPAAPNEIRGEFEPIATSMPGLQISEHLPKISQLMDRTTLVRSMTHKYPTHCVAYALSGIPENPLRDPRAYWPFYSSVMDYLWQRDPKTQSPLGMPNQMCLPFPLNSRSTNKSHRGLTAAWLGQEWEPVFGEFSGKASREKGFPSLKGPSHFDPFDGITRESTFRFMAPTTLDLAPKVGLAHKWARTGLDLQPGVTLDRLNRRQSLLDQFDTARKDLEKTQASRGFNRFQQMAFDMITSPVCSNALDVTQEPTALRDKYGYTLFGQAALAARRLVEAGSRVVTVYWDEYGPANSAWDTHVNNFPRLKEGLCPTLDQVYSTLMNDLDQRGMLDETVVLLVSEHGRTPKIGKTPGGSREHWSNAYCGLFAGAGIQQGQVIGATDKHAGYPADRPVNPKDILATLYHLMGFNTETTRTYDRQSRPHNLLPHGDVIEEMIV